MNLAPKRLLRWSVLVALGATGCGAEPTEQVTAAIFGGAPAPEDEAVVAVVNIAGGQCSGSLIAPRLVLTARHCVADTATEDSKVICGQTEFVEPDSPGAVFVVADLEITNDLDAYHALSAIVLPEGVDEDLCGTDVALLVLEQPLPGISPLVPRLDEPVTSGEPYSAVGYGIDEAVDGNPAGVRKRLDDLEVACLGRDCGVADVRDNEWVGSGGPCSGDSGGPALDASGRVIGVVSRGKDSCEEPVFGDVATRATWLRSEAIKLANAAHQAPPGWAPCGDPEPCHFDDELESSCGVAGGATTGWPSVLGAVVLLSGLVLRRRARARAAQPAESHRPRGRESRDEGATATNGGGAGTSP